MWEEIMCVLNYRKNIATVLAPNGHLFPKTFEARYTVTDRARHRVFVIKHSLKTSATTTDDPFAQVSTTVMSG